MTAVRLQAGPTLLSVAFGAPAELQDIPKAKLALFGPRQVVAYLARNRPAQALYLFRTAPANDVGIRLRHVSRPVDLFYVAHTHRTIEKATIALQAIVARRGAAGVDELPDIFWLRLADFIERRGWRIVYYVTRMLAEQRAGF
jgi:hypothetical protein